MLGLLPHKRLRETGANNGIGQSRHTRVFGEVVASHVILMLWPDRTMLRPLLHERPRVP